MRAHKNKPRKPRRQRNFYEPHPDVNWFGGEVEEADAVKPLRACKSRKHALLARVVPDTGREPGPVESKALPGTHIDPTFGVCLCWLCRNRPATRHDRDWMFGVLARDALRKPPIDQRLWLHDWTLRHGKFAGEILKLHMYQQQNVNGISRRRMPANL